MTIGGLAYTTTHDQYGLEIDEYAVHTDGNLAGMTTYRLYVIRKPYTHLNIYENVPWLKFSSLLVALALIIDWKFN